MKSFNALAKLVLLLILPMGLFAQNEQAKVKLPFDKAYFKEQNYSMLNMFASEIVVSPSMTNFIFVSPYSEYGIRGRSNTAGYDSLILKELVKEFDANSFEKTEKRVVKPGDELLNYFLENLDSNSIIAFRVVAKGVVEVMKYEILY